MGWDGRVFDEAGFDNYGMEEDVAFWGEDGEVVL